MISTSQLNWEAIGAIAGVVSLFLVLVLERERLWNTLWLRYLILASSIAAGVYLLHYNTSNVYWSSYSARYGALLGGVLGLLVCVVVKFVAVSNMTAAITNSSSRMLIIRKHIFRALPKWTLVGAVIGWLVGWNYNSIIRVLL